MNEKLIKKQDIKIKGKQEQQIYEEVKELEFLFDTPVTVSVELGRTTLKIKDIIELEKGSIVELKKSAGENLDIYFNRRAVAKGEVTIMEDTFGIRITDIIDPDKKW